MKTCTGFATTALIGWALALVLFAAWQRERDISRTAEANAVDRAQQYAVDSAEWATVLAAAAARIQALDSAASRPQPETRIHVYRTKFHGAPDDSLSAILDRLPSAE